MKQLPILRGETNNGSGGLTIEDRKREEIEVIADLDVLFWMAEYIELELERISPECVLSASALRAAITSEIIARKTVFAMRHTHN